MTYTLEEVRELFGDRIPKIGHAGPAAWWITTDQTQQDAYDRWVDDYEAHRTNIEGLAQTIGMHAEDAYYSSFYQSSTLSGFQVPTFMGHWNHEHPDYRPVPAGWRIDKKQNRLVPSRKTKADRESQANKDFAAVKAIPNINAYLTGMPSEIHLDDRDFGGTMYRVHYRRGDNCIAAFSGGDPDRQPEKRLNETTDTTIWQRQKLSVLLALGDN